MTERNASFATFSLQRSYNHPVAKVFAAFANQEAKDKWFGGPADEWTALERSFDFRPGGRESASGRFKTGMVSRFDCVYFEIVDNARIVYAYEMHLNDVRISVSLATIEFESLGGATKLTLTEQGVFVDGYEDKGSRAQGTAELLDALAVSLAG
jgi:uncharacterized protein YndB with AHSA1/START domain